MYARELLMECQGAPGAVHANETAIDKISWLADD
jgi:hypothetical protein